MHQSSPGHRHCRASCFTLPDGDPRQTIQDRLSSTRWPRAHDARELRLGAIHRSGGPAGMTDSLTLECVHSCPRPPDPDKTCLSKNATAQTAPETIPPVMCNLRCAPQWRRWYVRGYGYLGPHPPPPDISRLLRRPSWSPGAAAAAGSTKPPNDAPMMLRPIDAAAAPAPPPGARPLLLRPRPQQQQRAGYLAAVAGRLTTARAQPAAVGSGAAPADSPGGRRSSSGAEPSRSGSSSSSAAPAPPRQRLEDGAGVAN